ncbi:MAG: 2-oxo acid dehydrogenase subunit E2 [Candidatus Heimdallarchaeaceae archaeon]
MEKKKDYQIKKFSTTRKILADYNDVAATFPRVQGLIEMDVTIAIQKIKEIEEEEEYKISFTGWVAKCVAKAVSENKRLNSYRKGRSKIIVFDKIDISVMVEVVTKKGKYVPFNHVLRDVESKSIKDISDEIRRVQKEKIDELEQLTRGSTGFSSLYLLIPRFIRKLIIKKLLKNPFYLRKIIGTVGITSFGKNVKNLSGWAIPFADKTLNIAIGGMKKKAVVEDGKLVNKQLACLTFLFDHNLVDGAPAARFISRLAELMKEAYALEDISIS